MIKTKQEVVIEAMRKIKGVGDFQLIAETTKEALKKSRMTKLPTPNNLIFITKVTLTTVSLGNDYESGINERLEKEGKEGDFKAQATYCTPLTRIEVGLKGWANMVLGKMGLTVSDKLSKVIYKHNSKDQLYVRVYPNLAKSYSSNSVYFDADGASLSEEQFKVIELEYLPLRGEANQGGLEDKIIVNNYKIENVLYLGDDEKNPINELTAEKLKLVA